MLIVGAGIPLSHKGEQSPGGLVALWRGNVEAVIKGAAALCQARFMEFRMGVIPSIQEDGRNDDPLIGEGADHFVVAGDQFLVEIIILSIIVVL